MGNAHSSFIDIEPIYRIEKEDYTEKNYNTFSGHLIIERIFIPVLHLSTKSLLRTVCLFKTHAYAGKVGWAKFLSKRSEVACDENFAWPAWPGDCDLHVS